MNLNPYEFEKAKDGDLFVKKGDKLVAVSFAELNKENKQAILEQAKLGTKLNAVCKCLANFEKLSYSHFICVFNLFCNKVISGEIEIDDENLLKLDEKVLNGDLSVSKALNKHEFLKATFDKLYGKEYDDLKLLAKEIK